MQAATENNESIECDGSIQRQKALKYMSVSVVEEEDHSVKLINFQTKI